ncbi:PadR family transcriptional regulator [Alicyclobacillus mengziensis]|uniref:Helix-turn-helix transcriptional regulator n=1 Tax=Alicyclobacillus mengziensis TaxID=2931921 RepID=A0A9X7Z6W0_9BACL|nr:MULTISPECIES: helix-turn-helix transcriptional regulator [Alicyclobacillus]MCF8568202.1 helix-turn-helix transcriptional regulator [Alicyclobacillus tolerans]QSO46685.1 helix-turn-helix transcriptional regulator [Alicyclobacillus mengziensis]
MVKEGGVPGKQSRHLPAFILLFLAEQDKHGGALLNRLTDVMSGHQAIDSGAVYRVLRDLEQRGCVTSYWDTDEPGPAKRQYHITSEGIEELELWYNDICHRKKNLEYFMEQYESLNKNYSPRTDI